MQLERECAAAEQQIEANRARLSHLAQHAGTPRAAARSDKAGNSEAPSLVWSFQESKILESHLGKCLMEDRTIADGLEDAVALTKDRPTLATYVSYTHALVSRIAAAPYPSPKYKHSNFTCRWRLKAAKLRKATYAEGEKKKGQA